MKNFGTPALLAVIPAASALALFTASCAGPMEKPGTFASARHVIEANCVHCHGEQRLPNMPSFGDTLALAKLTGPSNWIVPGHPERSRFFQVVTLSDDQAGAMPPTGHAISERDAKTLRAWIQAGAPLPDGAPVKLTPRGEGPRSR